MKRLFPLFLLGLWPALAHAATSYTDSHAGVTWTWSEDREVGAYANGHPYVVGSITLTSVTPGWGDSDGDGDLDNGLMINPQPNALSSGFDTSLGAGHLVEYADLSYDAALNLADDLPVSVAVNSTLVKAVSKANPATGNKAQFSKFSFLTVVSSAPPAGSFMPPWWTSDKTPRATTADIDWANLPRLDAAGLSSVVSQSSAEGRLDGAWFIGGINHWRVSQYRPETDMSFYGRQIAQDRTGPSALWLMLDELDATKQAAAYDLYTIGLHAYEIYRDYGSNEDGQHLLGFLAPVLFAYGFTDDAALKADILSVLNDDSTFPEFRQTFRITTEDIARQTNGTNGDWSTSYTASFVDSGIGYVGQAEWGFKHVSEPNRDNPYFYAQATKTSTYPGTRLTYYRDQNGAAYPAIYMLAYLLGIQDEVANADFFDYTERYWELEKDERANTSLEIGLFGASVWDVYGPGGPNDTLGAPPSGAGGGDPAGSVATPAADVGSGSYLSGPSVTLSTSTAGADIHYTLNDAALSASSPLYSSPLTISGDTTLRFFARNGVDSDSLVQTVSYDVAPFELDAAWASAELSSVETGAFSYTFYATPHGNAVDAVVGLSDGEASEYTDLGPIVVFNASGVVQVRNGGAYGADTVYGYTQGQGYEIEISGNVSTRIYDVYVTAPGGARTQLAAGYAFRSEQAAVTQLTHLSFIDGTDTGLTLALEEPPVGGYPQDTASRGSGAVRSAGGPNRLVINPWGTGALRIRE